MTSGLVARILVTGGFVALIGAGWVHIRANAVQGVPTDANANATLPARVADSGRKEDRAPLSERAAIAFILREDSVPVTQPAAAERNVAVHSSTAQTPRPAVLSPSSPPAARPTLAEQVAAPAPMVARGPTLIDINSASADELNRLGGRFGKAIIQGRPYGSIDELVSKRILTRTAFGRIKDQITVR